MNLWEFLCRGGPVMIPLFVVSILIWWIGLSLWFQLGDTGEKTGATPAPATRKPQNTLTVLKALTGVAPYLGLLGTVGGMMMAFEGLLQFGPGNFRGLSEGIARALVTTQAGLLVALSGLLFLVLLQSRVTRIESTIPSRNSSRRTRRWRHG